MSEWHPIETAPNDGTPVLIATGCGIILAVRSADWWAVVYDSFGSVAYDLQPEGAGRPLVMAPVTHWMPLPEPPHSDTLPPAQRRVARADKAEKAP